jgi:hypothetical protein
MHDANLLVHAVISGFSPQSNSCTNGYNTAHENGSVASPKTNDRRSICV